MQHVKSLLLFKKARSHAGMACFPMQMAESGSPAAAPAFLLCQIPAS